MRAGEAGVPVLFAGHLCEVLFLFGASVLIVKSLFSARTLKLTASSALSAATCSWGWLGPSSTR